MNKKICVIGGGRWGQNHIKTLYEIGSLSCIVESNAQRLNELIAKYPVEGLNNIDEAINKRFDGYTVAAPAETHYEMGKKLLGAGLNVLIEKPLTLTSGEAAELVEFAEKNNCRLMVGHLLLFHPAIRKIKEVIDSGKLGKIHYIYSTRLNLGTVRTEEHVFWSFAPHDISVLDFLIGKPAIRVEATGSKFLQENIYDFTTAHFEYPDNVHAHIFVSWLHPFKEQRLVVVGSEGMISFDDSTADKSIIYYNKHIDWDNGKPIKVEKPDEIIPYEKAMPLYEELSYFINHLDKKIEIAGGESGYEVVKVLEKVQKLLDKE